MMRCPLRCANFWAALTAFTTARATIKVVRRRPDRGADFRARSIRCCGLIGDRAQRAVRESDVHNANRALSQRESDDVLPMLFRHIENPEFQCASGGTRNSVAFWDNRCAQHQAICGLFSEP